MQTQHEVHEPAAKGRETLAGTAGSLPKLLAVHAGSKREIMATLTSPFKAFPHSVELPNIPLLETDGEPLETDWHRVAIALLLEMLYFCWRGRTDFFAGGNMFIYYSEQQVRAQDYRGPDFFCVKGVDGTSQRKYWVVWLEDGKYPDAIIELLSPRTAVIDRTTKKTLYESTFRTPEYFCYDPDARRLEGWRLNGQHRYQDIPANENGWLWSEELQLWLGTWEGSYLERSATWLRFYDDQGRLVPTRAEAAEAALKVKDIKLTQAEADLKVTQSNLTQAEADLKVKDMKLAQAEADLKVKDIKLTQAEAEIARLKPLLTEKGTPLPPAKDVSS